MLHGIVPQRTAGGATRDVDAENWREFEAPGGIIYGHPHHMRNVEVADGYGVVSKVHGRVASGYWPAP